LQRGKELLFFAGLLSSHEVEDSFKAFRHFFKYVSLENCKEEFKLTKLDKTANMIFVTRYGFTK